MRRQRRSRFNPAQRARQLAREASLSGTHAATTSLRESIRVTWTGGQILCPGTRNVTDLQHGINLARWASSQRSTATVYHGNTVLFIANPDRLEPFIGIELAKRKRYASPLDKHHDPRRLDSRYYKG